MNDRANGSAEVLAPELMARVRRIQIKTRLSVSSALQGAYRSTFRGAGLEFEDVRPYQPGDEVRSIDWKVTARTGEPFIKTYQEDRQLTIQLLVDTSRSMDFGSREKTKREAAAELAALVALVAGAQGDQVGLQLVDEHAGVRLAPEKGQRHVLRLVREVVGAPAHGRGSALVGVLEDELAHQKRRALLFVVSDFLGVDHEALARVLGRVARRHDVILARVCDPFEVELPSGGLLVLEDVESAGRVEVDLGSRRVRERWKDDARARREAFDRMASKAGVDRIEVVTDGDVAEPLVRLFQRRVRARGGRR